jgi:hypothetical protein
MEALDIIVILLMAILLLTINNHLKQKFIMATQAELAQQLRDITAQNEKSRTEILAKIADLETALANAGNTSPEVDEAVAALKASVQTDDDIVPDAPTA